MHRLLALVLLAGTALAGSEVPLETVRFEIDHVTSPGESVFVLGDIPELGNDRIRRAVKLVPGSYDPGPPASLPWTIDIAIPQGTTYTWRFVVRDDAVADLSDPSNGSDLTAPVTDSTPPPTPATRDLLVYKNNAGPVTEITFAAPDGDVLVPFRPLATRPDLLAAILRDQPFGPGIEGEINGGSLTTPLHTVLRRGAQVYNYDSSDAVSDVDGFVIDDVLPTGTIVATRNIDGVNGRGLRIYLPRGYAEHTDRHYPVLYMHDGQNVFLPGGPFGTWQAEVTAAELIKQGRVRELIIVGIDNSSNRLPEYNPEWQNSQNAAYNSFIVNELVPYIDANFRTLSGPDNTGVAGSSFGGIASLSLGSSHPDVFGRVAALSTSWWATTFDNDLAAGTFPALPRLYLDVGDTSDGADEAFLARDSALANGWVLHDDLYFQIGYGQQHNEAAWTLRFDEALEYLFPITDEPNTLALPVPLAGDTNGDACVDLSDLAAVLAAFGTCGGDASYDALSDFNADQCVDVSDLATVLAGFGEGC